MSKRAFTNIESKIDILSSDTNKSVPLSANYTGSTVNVGSYVYKSIVGVFSGSNDLGVTQTLFLSWSRDNVLWNNWDTSASITSGSVPNIVSVTAGVPVAYIRGILRNASGSALSGSIYVLGMNY